ncbi:MAG TPA: hypothetical protein VF331_00395 [Polyangiales bacterium]
MRSALPDEIVGVLVARTDVLQDAQQRENLAGVLRAVETVLHTLSPRSATFAPMAPRLSLTPAQVERSLRGIMLTTLAAPARLLEGKPPVLEQRAALMARRRHDVGLLPTLPRSSGLVDVRVLHEARA